VEQAASLKQCESGSWPIGQMDDRPTSSLVKAGPCGLAHGFLAWNARKKRKFAKQQELYRLGLDLQLDNPNKYESAVASLTGSHGALVEPNR